MIPTNKISKSISDKVKGSVVVNKTLNIDVNDDCMVKGWAASNSDRSLSVLISIVSSTDSISIVANQHRPDVRRVGLHKTGLCGFQYDISAWVDKKVTVSIVNVINNDKEVDFAPSFFLHIPKTAGTSFKRAAQEYFGKEGVVRNYGKESIETTPWVNKVVLENKDFPTLYRRLKQEGIGLYTGHLTAQPTANVFPIKNIVTFMRRPMAQVLSHYHHYVRWYNYENTIENFVKNPGFKNLQARYLKGLPLQLVGFIGLTEEYAESINLYNSFTGFNLEVREDNINSHNSAAAIPNKLSLLIAEHNKLDNVLYDQAVSLLNERSRLVKSGKDWCFSFIDRLDESEVAGVAFMQSDDKPVNLVIKHKRKVIGHCVANDFRPGLVQFNVPNKGFIGFSFSLPAKFNHRNISVEIQSTGQVLQRKF
jgi:hypothetical protein